LILYRKCFIHCVHLLYRLFGAVMGAFLKLLEGHSLGLRLKIHLVSYPNFQETV